MSLIKIWKNKDKILEGLKNKIFKQEHVEEIYNERMSICKKCPYLDTEGDKCYISGTQPCCGICGCSLELKLRSLSSECDESKWKAILTEEEDDELQKQINKNN